MELTTVQALKSDHLRETVVVTGGGCLREENLFSDQPLKRCKNDVLQHHHVWELPTHQRGYNTSTVVSFNNIQFYYPITHILTSIYFVVSIRVEYLFNAVLNDCNQSRWDSRLQNQEKAQLGNPKGGSGHLREWSLMGSLMYASIFTFRTFFWEYKQGFVRLLT